MKKLKTPGFSPPDVPPPDDYLGYKQWFDASHNRLKLPQDCREPAPPAFYFATLYSWHMEWFLIFDDQQYLRIWEHFARRAGLQMARRIGFVFHYGPIVGRDANGLPDHRSSDPVVIRIDDVHGPVHLHNGAPDPHIPQANIRGLQLDALDMFTFAKAVFKHRASGRTIADTLAFKVV